MYEKCNNVSRAEEPEAEAAACLWPLGAGAASKKPGAGAAAPVPASRI